MSAKTPQDVIVGGGNPRITNGALSVQFRPAQPAVSISVTPEEKIAENLKAKHIEESYL